MVLIRVAKTFRANTYFYKQFNKMAGIFTFSHSFKCYKFLEDSTGISMLGFRTMIKECLNLIMETDV